MMSFPEFLESSQISVSNRSKGPNDDTSPIHLVLGNEAGDADSIISSLSLAYVNGRSSDFLNVPLVSIQRSDLPLRRDVVYLLDMAGVSTDSLLYIDDHTVNDILRDAAPTSMTLVDHNRIKSSLSFLSDNISEILDHHEDECSHEHVTIDSGNRVIAFDKGLATVASTCTLVAERLLRELGSASIDRSLGLVLLGVILLDSVNMLPEAGKGTPRDESAIQALMNRTDWSTSPKRSPTLVGDDALKKIFPNGKDTMPDRTALFDALSGAKFDPKFWQEMSARDCLRIDYKRFSVEGESLVQAIGMSTVLLDVRSVLAKQHFHSTMADFVSAEDVDIFGVMTMHVNDGGTWIRELLLTGRDTSLVDVFAQYLLKHPDAAFLQIKEDMECLKDEKESMHTRIFSQGNVKGSRKQVAPVFLNYASSLSRL